MLTSTRAYHQNDELDFVHNYYEKLVMEEIYQQSERARSGDRDFVADASCVALNHLPPRYIRHDVDMTFFMSPQEMLEIQNKVSGAVKLALAYVESRERGPDSGLPEIRTVASDTGKEKKNSEGKKHKK